MEKERLAEIKLEAVQIFHVSMRLRHPFQTSFGVEHDRQCLILGVEADGLIGWGECVAGKFPGYSYETAETAWHVLEDFFIPALAQYPSIAPQELRNALRGFKGHPLARAGLEMALWDLLGKRQGRSLKALFGGQRSRVEVGVSIGIQEDLPGMIAKVDGFLAKGYQRIKVKIKPGADLDIIAGIRQYHPEIKLQVDANSAYGIEDAEHLAQLDDHDLQLIEQPFAEDDILDHAQLQKQLNTALCLDESILSLRHACQATRVGACRVINIKPGRVGGLSEALAIHNFCYEEGVPVWCGGMLETNVGRAANLAIATLPGFILPGDISASERYYETDIAAPGFILNADSTIDVPDHPGLGVEIDLNALDKSSLRKTRLIF
jgi:O-succinylbenzoate synthase